MNNDEKILKALADLQADVTAMKGDIGKQLEQQGNTLTQQGKLLSGIAATMGTVLEEQQAQRMDIRSLHSEVHASKEELKGEILSARAEAKRDNIDLKATVVKELKDDKKRIEALEDAAEIPHPDKTGVRTHFPKWPLI